VTSNHRSDRKEDRALERR